MTDPLAPVRLTLSRAKGFNLQAASMARNGMPAVIVARPSKWGNPWPVSDVAQLLGDLALERFQTYSPLVGFMRHAVQKETAQISVNLFRVALEMAIGHDADQLEKVQSLRGKNLACWCKPGAPCHADVLLEIANRPNCECEEVK